MNLKKILESLELKADGKLKFSEKQIKLWEIVHTSYVGKNVARNYSDYEFVK